MPREIQCDNHMSLYKSNKNVGIACKQKRKLRLFVFFSFFFAIVCYSMRETQIASVTTMTILQEKYK